MGSHFFSKMTSVVGRDIFTHSNITLLDYPHCYACRSPDLTLRAVDNIKVCGCCGRVQDFLLPACPFVGCTSPRIPSFCILGKTPDDLLDCTYFCSKEHLVVDERTTPPKKRHLSPPLEEITERKKYRTRVKTTKDTFEDLRSFGFNSKDSRTILRTVKEIDKKGSFEIGETFVCNIISAFSAVPTVGFVTRVCYSKWRLQIIKT